MDAVGDLCLSSPALSAGRTCPEPSGRVRTPSDPRRAKSSNRVTMNLFDFSILIQMVNGILKSLHHQQSGANEIIIMIVNEEEIRKHKNLFLPDKQNSKASLCSISTLTLQGSHGDG